MQRIGRLAVATLILGASVFGCGGDTKNEGPPKNLDMSKDYSPKASANMFPQPADAKKAQPTRNAVGAGMPVGNTSQK